MREIKLRFWNTITKEMVYSPKIREDYQFDLNEYLNTDRGWVWMQYTGLKDSNGKEIYEGDVLEYNLAIGVFDERKTMPVEYKDGCFRVSNCPVYIITEESGFGTKIIGNIYENPELISEK